MQSALQCFGSTDLRPAELSAFTVLHFDRQWVRFRRSPKTCRNLYLYFKLLSKCLWLITYSNVVACFLCLVWNPGEVLTTEVPCVSVEVKPNYFGSIHVALETTLTKRWRPFQAELFATRDEAPPSSREYVKRWNKELAPIRLQTLPVYS